MRRSVYRYHCVQTGSGAHHKFCPTTIDVYLPRGKGGRSVTLNNGSLPLWPIRLRPTSRFTLYLSVTNESYYEQYSRVEGGTAAKDSNRVCALRKPLRLGNLLSFCLGTGILEEIYGPFL
jgi:hypothetical protein